MNPLDDRSPDRLLDAELDRLLQADACQQPHISDAGFTDRLMARLPPPRREAPRWLLPASALAGSAAALVLTPAGDWLLRTVPALFLSPLPMPLLLGLAVPGVAVYALLFSIARER